MTQGQLLSNVVAITFDPKFTWHRTGVDFDGHMSRRIRAQLFEGARSQLAAPGTLKPSETKRNHHFTHI